MAKTKRAPKEKTRVGKTAAAASILDKYERLKRELGHAGGTALIAEIAGECASFLASETKVLPLRSMVEGKSYFAFRHSDAKRARPVR